MERRLYCITVALLALLVFTASPTWAEEYAFGIAGTKVTSENVDKLKDISGVTLGTGGELKYDPTKKLLSLKNVTITSPDGKIAIENAGNADLKIEVAGNNNISSKNADGLSFGASATIMGDGSLTVKTEGNNSAIYVRTGATLTVENTMLTAEGKNGIFGQDGRNGTLIIRNATVSAKGADLALADLATLTLEKSHIVSPEGGYWDAGKHAVMASGSKAKEVKIEPSYGFYIAGVVVTSTNMAKLNEITGVTLGTDGELKYAPTTNTLTLKNVTIASPDRKIAIENAGNADLKIEVAGNNNITSKNADGLTFGASATITGEGTLTVTTEGHNSAIYVPSATLTVENTTLSAEGYHGIFGQDGKNVTLIIRNATVNAKGRKGESGYAIADFATLTLDKCFIFSPKEGKWDAGKHAVMDGSSKAKEVEVKRFVGFNLEPTTLEEIPAEGGMPSVNVISEKAWTLSMPAEATWVTPSATTGTGSQTVRFTVEKNETSSMRSVKVTFTQSETTYTLELEIKQAGKLHIPLTGIEIVPNSLPIKVEGSSKLTLKFKPDDATNKEVTWAVTEGNESLTVDQEGNIRATKVAGTATVTVTSKENPTITAKCNVRVTSDDVPVESIEVIPATLELTEGKSATLGVKITPQTATNQEVTWSIKSGNEYITLSGNMVNGVKEGQAEVEAKVGDKTNVCKITVKKKIAVTSVRIEPGVVTLSVGKTQQLKAIIEPSTATNQKVTWTLTSGDGVVTLSATGLVTAVKKGTAKVTATVDGQTAMCTVNVTESKVPKAVEDAVLSTVIVAPNPFTTQLRILNPEGASMTYELLNLAGQVLRAGALNGIEMVVDTADLPAGGYFARLTGENGAKRTIRIICIR